MSDSKQEITQTEDGTGVVYKSSKKQLLLQHFKRFWWLHLIFFICGTALAVSLTIFVGVPRIAQKKINSAKLGIEGVNVLETESNAYRLEINSSITTDGSTKANIDPFEGQMYLEDFEPHVAFSTVQFPKTNGNKHQVVNISQQMDIVDMDAYTRFNIWFHNNESVRVTVEGRTKVKPAGLERKWGVTFKKTVTLSGLNVFNGTTVANGHISLEEDDNGKNFNATANIPNASVFTLDIGNCTFDNYIEEEKVGTLYIDNLVLVPGNNPVFITANMDQVKILEIARQRPYCETGVIPFKLLGTRVENHGQNLSYFEAALASINQTVPIDIGTIIKNVLKTTIRCADD